MEMNEKTIDYLEQSIPELAQAATRQAYWQALASGSFSRWHKTDNKKT
jgi:hypothetical protein